MIAEFAPQTIVSEGSNYSMETELADDCQYGLEIYDIEMLAGLLRDTVLLRYAPSRQMQRYPSGGGYVSR